jgi:hypothetical protein
MNEIESAIIKLNGMDVFQECRLILRFWEVQFFRC